MGFYDTVDFAFVFCVRVVLRAPNDVCAYFFFWVNCGSNVVASVVLPQLCNHLHFKKK